MMSIEIMMTLYISSVNCCRGSARQHTILDVLRILQSSLDPVFCADLCIVEKSIRVGRLDVHFPGEKVEFQVMF